MNFSEETKDSIRRFAREQAGRHLSSAELSYFEQLGRKSGQTKEKLLKQMAKFKLTSDQTMEARDDLTLYMSDYVADLMEQGHTEKEALRLAKQALASDSQSDQAADLQDKYMRYYLDRDPAVDETIGLYYAGFLMLGLVLGIVGGIFLALYVFPDRFWPSLIFTSLLGVLAGLACGMLKHASTVSKK
ncbi:hypothetical protein J31TS4_45570 [Paenibacillus sp. J31TS4]|uniref:hypothetical protein n=1 Tax=Paenibacillus sp. J31TS4 TaxID=2807195 RepID=UPI001B1FE296|nr:hypothetical protein [Paenibacillus sp. J31TS4]GIP41277.1 hypothetical protein J31TS4_45570 [Paenibacillus sp. J31TS4]